MASVVRVPIFASLGCRETSAQLQAPSFAALGRGRAK